jgi:hypothetical protein
VLAADHRAFTAAPVRRSPTSTPGAQGWRSACFVPRGAELDARLADAGSFRPKGSDKTMLQGFVSVSEEPPNDAIFSPWEADGLNVATQIEETTERLPSFVLKLGVGKLRDQFQALEHHLILSALDRCAGNQTRAAALLGIPRRTLITRLTAYGIARPRLGPPSSPPHPLDADGSDVAVG